MAVAQLKGTNHGKHTPVSAMDLDYVDELVTESNRYIISICILNMLSIKYKTLCCKCFFSRIVSVTLLGLLAAKSSEPDVHRRLHGFHRLSQRHCHVCKILCIADPTFRSL